MKKLLFLLLLPLSSFTQSTEEYYVDGNKVIEKSWVVGKQTRTKLETFIDEGSAFKYYIDDGEIKIGTTVSIVREYGKYFKIDISIINKSTNRFDFEPSQIEVIVKGDIRKKDKYKQLSFSDYNKKVERRQAFATGLVAGLNGFNEGYSAGNNYSTNTSTNWDKGYPQTTTTQTESYSPTLANIQRQQNQNNLNEMLEAGNKDIKYIREGYLKRHTLFPNTALEGYILVPYNRKITDGGVIVNIGDKKFDFSGDEWL